MKSTLRKLLAMLLICLLLGGLVACGEEELSPAEQAKINLEKALSGEFTLVGKTYRLPMPLKTLLDAGWADNGFMGHADEVQPVGEEIDPYKTTQTLTLSNGEQSILVCCYNPTNQTLPLEQATVYLVRVYTATDLTLAGNVSYNSNRLAVMNAYGVPPVKEELVDDESLSYGNLPEHFAAVLAQQTHTFIRDKEPRSGLYFQFNNGTMTTLVVYNIQW